MTANQLVDTGLEGLDLGIDAERFAFAEHNPWLLAQPVRFVAPFPDELVEVQQRFNELTAEIAALNVDIIEATRAGDGARVLELRARKEVLPGLLGDTEVALLQLQRQHLEASIALIHPYTDRLIEIQTVKQRARAAAELEETQVGYALMSATGTRWQMEDALNAANRRQAELLYPDVVSMDALIEQTALRDSELASSNDAIAESKAVQLRQGRDRIEHAIEAKGQQMKRVLDALEKAEKAKAAGKPGSRRR